ncbi:MAG: YjcQ family protein [Ruminococcus flavefaciens]|nr:YjcQ family protein [Ruminococcus flavefaciens]
MDNFKVMYKILRELEKNMGNEKFSVKTISAEKLKISFEKWEQLLILMQDEGYINGLVLSKDLESMYQHIVEPIKPKITMKGLDYLANNSTIAKAKEMLKMAGEIV